MNSAEVARMVKKRAYLDFKNQKEYAKHLGCSTTFLSGIINETKEPSGVILKDLGLKKKVIYIKEE